MHTFKRFDAAGICKGSVLMLLNDFRGGGQQKRKLSIVELKALDADPDKIKMIFGLTSFKVC